MGKVKALALFVALATEQDLEQLADDLVEVLDKSPESLTRLADALGRLAGLLRERDLSEN